MTNDPRLEHYLSSLENALRPFPVSDRAEIITEIKSHILSALERDPSSNLESVLAAMGEPETVANRYLMERGIKPTKPPISSAAKWLVIGCLGSVGLMMLFVIILTGMAFSHIGSLAEFAEKNSGKRFWFGGSSFEISTGNDKKISGSLTLPKAKKVAVKFSNGKYELTNSKGDELSWKCRVPDDKKKEFAPATDAEGSTLDFRSYAGSKCEISIPADAKVAVQGGNGKVDILNPHYDLNLDLSNGKVDIAPDSKLQYRYDLSVTNGLVDTFKSSADAKAHSIAVHLINGKISQSGDDDDSDNSEEDKE